MRHLVAQAYRDPHGAYRPVLAAAARAGSEDKPVGTVWIAIGLRDRMVHTRKFRFEGDRNQVRIQAVEAALKALLELIEGG